MNRFDRITAILLQLQAKRLITAQQLADQFEVSLRTVYRDIRTLETAGVPIISETGLGYFLDKGYRLPPVMFNQEEALALFVAEKFIQQANDDVTKRAYKNALYKIKAVLNSKEKDHLESLNKRIDVQHVKHNVQGSDPWLLEVQQAIASSVVLEINYFTPSRSRSSLRQVEPIGLYFYSSHWHLIAWCRIKDDYRDFRLDRIQSLQNTQQWFDQRQRGDLSSYLAQSKQQVELYTVEVRFSSSVALYTHEQRYWYGYLSEVKGKEGAVDMTFLTHSMDYIARWLLGYTNGAQVLRPKALKQKMCLLMLELQEVIG